MCGRFERHSALSEFSKIVAGLVAEGIDPLPPSYNIAPSQAALVVRHQTGAHRVDLLTWGLVPGWMKEPGKIRPINARAETIHGMNHLRVAGEIGPTAENLRNVTVGDTKEFSFMYPRMIRDAQDEGRQDAVDSFAWRWKGKDITWMFLPKRCSGWRRVRRRHRSLSHPPRHPP